MKKIFVAILFITGSLFAMGQTYSGQKNPTLQEKLNEEYCSALFKNADGAILEVSEDQSVQGYLNILSWLDGRVAGLQVYSTWSGIKVPFIRGSHAKIYVDEIAVDDEYLNSLPVSDIAMIKVIKGPSASIFGANAVIAIYTLKGDDDEEDIE